MKKLILSLFVLLFGIINFSNAGFYTFTGIVTQNTHRVTLPNGLINGCDFYISCFYNNTVNDYITLGIQYNGNSNTSVGNINLNRNYQIIGYNFNKINGCTTVNKLGFYLYNDNNYNYTCFLNGNSIINSNCPTCPTCPEQYTKGECQVQYNLIPVENVDQHYCETNELCPEYECEENTGGNLSGLNWSALFINDLQFPGKSIIDISIPDYITWDYSSSEEKFNLYVGSGYDQDYINSIIGINSYRPDSGDFTNIFVSGLTLIFPYIVITLFIIFVWKLLKRIFK